MMKKHDLLGPLIKQNNNVWTTENPFYFKYKFSKEIFAKVSNVKLPGLLKPSRLGRLKVFSRLESTKAIVNKFPVSA